MTNLQALELKLAWECKKFNYQLVEKYQENLAEVERLGKLTEFYDNLLAAEEPFEEEDTIFKISETFNKFYNLKLKTKRQEAIINSVAYQLHLNNVVEIKTEIEEAKVQELIELHERQLLLESVAQPLTAFSYAN